MTSDKEALLRRIPAVERILQDPSLAELGGEGTPRTVLTDCVRQAVGEMRDLLSGEESISEACEDSIQEAILIRTRELVRESAGPFYRKAINATGIILHTGLGRAVLAPKALAQVQSELSGYSLLQVDVETGKRSRRDARIEWLLSRLTGAESATVVNNNAAATLLVLNTVGKDREVIVSRGQLVEIGGSFRLPEVMAAGGARMVEVGTTNKTHPRDYENAVTERTAAILRVHPSNYKIVGFTEEVSAAELAKIAHAHGLVFIDDVGAGALIDFSRFGFAKEPTLPESIADGADLVTSSADKLIGAGQGGLILGKRQLVEAVRKNPLTRALRVGKITLAVLEATLSCFLDEAAALADIPTLRMLRRDLADLAAQADRIAAALARYEGLQVAVIDGFSQLGSGSLPEQNLPTRLVALTSEAIGTDDLARRLRRAAPPVFARIQDDRLLIDPRTLLAGDEQILLDALAAAVVPR